MTGPAFLLSPRWWLRSLASIAVTSALAIVLTAAWALERVTRR